MRYAERCLREVARLERMRKRLAREEVPFIYAVAQYRDFQRREVAVSVGVEHVIKKMKKIGTISGVRFFYNEEDGEFYSGRNNQQKVERTNGRDHSYPLVVLLSPGNADWALLAKLLDRMVA